MVVPARLAINTLPAEFFGKAACCCVFMIMELPARLDFNGSDLCWVSAFLLIFFTFLFRYIVIRRKKCFQ